MLVSFFILFLCLALGFPIYLALLASGMYTLMFVLGMDASSVVLVMYDSVAKFTLVAVPFFLLSGAILENSSLARRLVEWLFSLVGSVRGGVALTGILANEFFGAVSGSSAAATGTVGKILYPQISKTMGERFALGLLTSAGALAIIMPPSIAMILYGSTANVSVGTLFLTGIVPALTIGLVIGIYIIWRGKRDASLDRFHWRTFYQKTKLAFWILLLPPVVFGGIYTGWFTPTEAAAVSVVYALFVAVVIYRELGMKSFAASVWNASVLTGQIFILIASSAVFSQALTFAQVPQKLVMLTADMDPWMFILMINLFLLIIGMFFDPTSAILVLTPLLVPIAQNLGIDLIHLGIIVTVNLAIGMFTPPFGLNLFVSQGVFHKSLTEVVASLKPFWVWYLLSLAILSYFPQLYMWIPQAAQP